MIARRRLVGRRLGVAGLLLALLLAADTLAWLQMQQLLDRRLRLLVQDAARSGWVLAAAGERRGGWPLAARLTLAAPRAHGADALFPGGVTWSGERVSATLSLLHPRRVAFSAAGIQTLSAGGARKLGDSLRFRSVASDLHLPAGTRDGVGQLSFEATGLRLALPGAGPDGVVAVAGLQGRLRWTPQALALTLALRGIEPPRGTAVPAGSAIPAAALELSLIGSAGGGGGLAARLRDWRAGGGRLLLRQATIDWKDAGIEAAGHVALDGNLQPDGGFTVQVTGADAMLDRLAQSGRLDPSAVAAVRAVLGLISAARDEPPDRPPGRPSAKAVGRPLQLPLTLHGGLLSLGQIPLLRIPDLPGAMPSP